MTRNCCKYLVFALFVLFTSIARTKGAETRSHNWEGDTAHWMVRPDENKTDINYTPEESSPCAAQYQDETLANDEKVISIRILSYEPYGVDQITPNARDYEAYTGGRVKIESVTTPSLTQLYEEIENDARSGGALFDGYYTNPIPMGTAVMQHGFLDLTPFLKDNPLAEWTDVLPALRKYVTSFEDKAYMVLMDGDTHSMFYRKDVLNEFGLRVPRTWNEYIEVAAAVHGKTFLNKTLSGSCVSRIGGDHAQFWAHLILSSITQTKGTSTGSLFDTKDMKPLAGAAMAEMIRIQEMQSKYGTPDGTYR
jgi:multiple sugar transport system substrate-binding protein